MTRLLKPFWCGAAQYIVPPSAPGPLPEKRCFDPNRCACLHYAGENIVSRAGIALTYTPIINSVAASQTPGWVKASVELTPL